MPCTLICLSINFSPGPTSIMKPFSLYLKEPQLSGPFLSWNPWSFVIWIICYLIIYCPIRKQGIWSKEPFLVIYFSVVGNLFVHWHGFTSLIYFLTLNTFYSVFRTSEVAIIFVHQRGQSCNTFLAFWSLFLIFSHWLPIFPDKITVC